MKCPKCKTEIDCIEFDVNAGCSSTLYATDRYATYDPQDLEEEFSNFRCPECKTEIAEDENEAKELLRVKA